MKEFLVNVDFFLWNGFLIYVLLGVGLYFTICLRGMQFRYLFHGLKLAFFVRSDRNADGDISQFQSLMTALAATIGIGSIAGMATAVTAGGFGAVFWMWVVASIGMVTKYAEAILAVKYRRQDENGKMSGGPMHYIEQGLGWKGLAKSFALFGALCAFAGGNLTQSHSIAVAMHEMLEMPHLWTGIAVAVLTGAVIIGGIEGLGKVNAVLVPVMALFYIAGGFVILAIHADKIPSSFMMIFQNAFSKQAAVGGFLGAGVMSAIQMGIVRGISSNEAGLGSAPIAAAAAKTDVPGRQALISMTGVFLSSFIICTITVLVICVTGVFGAVDSQGVMLNGVALVIHAFETTLPSGGWIVATGIVLFGYSTILGWSYYGEKCVEYLFGQQMMTPYRILFILVALFAPLFSLDIVWSLVDIMNGLMALPNLIGLFFLAPIVIRESREFFQLLMREKTLKFPLKDGG